jgi:hypothetical protein
MRAEHHHKANLKVRVPRGNEGFWQIICQLHSSQGTFTVVDIDGESCVNPQLIRKYIRLLIAGGFVERIGRDRGKFASASFRLLKSPNRAPRVRPDGSMIHANAIEHLWTAIRTLKSFGLRELMFAASTPEVAPTYALAKRYAAYLTRAGYLSVKANAGKHTWRLKPGMNTGPLPPAIQEVRAEVMWDRNLKAFVGEAPIASEVSP